MGSGCDLEGKPCGFLFVAALLVRLCIDILEGGSCKDSILKGVLASC